VDSHSWQQVRAWTYPEFIAERRRARSAHRSHLVIVRSQTLVGRGGLEPSTSAVSDAERCA
jgi:hypothetical protein